MQDELLGGLVLVKNTIARGWTTGKYARDKEGKPTLPRATDATCWCLVGACMAVVAPGSGKRAPLEEALRAETGDLGVAEWNDAPGRTHEEVLALVDRAIEKAQGRPIAKAL